MAASYPFICLDLINGSDSALNSITVDMVSDGSGKVKCTLASHGLIDGAAVVVPSGTYAGTYLVEVIDSDNFRITNSNGIIMMSFMPVIYENEFFTIGNETYTFKNNPVNATDIKIDQKNQFEEILTVVQDHSALVNALISDTFSTNSGVGLMFISKKPSLSFNSLTLACSANISIFQHVAVSHVTYSANRLATAITPLRGYSWATAFKTPNAIATAFPSYPIIKVAKTNDPVSTGVTGTFAYGNNAITIPTGNAKQLVTGGEPVSNWIASTNVTKSHTTADGRYIGDVNLFTVAGAFTTGKVCYYTLPSTIDLSTFSKLNFWWKSSSTISGYFRVCLCSDLVGDVPVNSFDIPLTVSNKYTPLNFDNGAFLGNNINSIAIYVITDSASVFSFSIQNVFASNIFNLSQIIRASGSEFIYNIQGVTDSSILIDRGYNGSIANGKVFDNGSFVIEEIPKISFIDLAAATTLPLSFSGLLSFIGGYDTSLDKKTWYTVLYSNNGNGTLFYSSATTKHLEGFVFSGFYEITYNNISPVIYDCKIISINYYQFYNTLGNPSGFAAINSCFLNSISYVYYDGGLTSGNLYFNCLFLQNSITIPVRASGVTILYCDFHFTSVTNNGLLLNFVIKSNFYNSILSQSYSKWKFIECIIYYNSLHATEQLANSYSSEMEFINCELTNMRLWNYYAIMKFDYCLFTNVVYSSQSNKDIIHKNHNRILGNNFSLYNPSAGIKSLFWTDTVKRTADSLGVWAYYKGTSSGLFQINLAKTLGNGGSLNKVPLAEIALSANIEVTISYWVLLADPVSTSGRLVIAVDTEYSMGIIEKWSNPKTIDSNWEKLSITITPVNSGVVKIYLLDLLTASPTPPTVTAYIGEIEL